jgi:hypothetical protein
MKHLIRAALEEEVSQNPWRSISRVSAEADEPCQSDYSDWLEYTIGRIRLIRHHLGYITAQPSLVTLPQ